MRTEIGKGLFKNLRDFFKFYLPVESFSLVTEQNSDGLFIWRNLDFYIAERFKVLNIPYFFLEKLFTSLGKTDNH